MIQKYQLSQFLSQTINAVEMAKNLKRKQKLLQEYRNSPRAIALQTTTIMSKNSPITTERNSLPSQWQDSRVSNNSDGRRNDSKLSK